MKRYSQLTAMMAITKASLKAILRSPSAIVFSFAFPFIFILVFGFIGDSGGMQHYNVAVTNDIDTANNLYKTLAHTDAVTMKRYSNEDSLQMDLQKGNLAGGMNI